MSIKIDDTAMQAAVAKAVLDTLTPERRSELIAEAIKSLLAAPANPGRFDDKRSKLQQAFDEAVYSVTATVAREELAHDGALKAKVRELMLAAWDKLTIADAYDTLTDKIAESIRRALTGERY